MPSAATIDISELLESRAGVQGGRPTIRGTGISVESVVAAHLFHQIPLSEIADENSVDIAALHAALAYYYKHQAEMEADYAADVAWGNEQIETTMNARK